MGSKRKRADQLSREGEVQVCLGMYLRVVSVTYFLVTTERLERGDRSCRGSSAVVRSREQSHRYTY